jgi:dolichyl-diphosphooligosaccharide--protein glycosyltransferase
MRNIRIPRSTDLLVIIWSLLLLLLTLAQNRFAYYYAVNVAVLSGYLSVLIMNKTGFGELEKAMLDKSPSNALRSTLQIWHPFVALALVLLFIVPGLTFTLHAESYVGGPPDDWYSSVKWLENNTPSPGLDISIIYERPPKGADFTYPETAYGVMSWWDYGHWIETIGHRIPNANPFQQGIGNRSDGTPGSSPFFLAESEDEAEGVLARLDENRSLYMNSRYIITDVEMARSKFYAMASWSNEPITKYYGIFYQQQGEQFAPVQIFREPYFRTIVMRLHFFDGSETPVGDAFAVAYRTVEQEGLQFSVIVDQPKISRNYSELLEFVDEKRYEGYKAETVSESFLSPAVPLEALKHYRLVHESATAVTLDGQKYVKIFEHVPGATITGKAKAGTVATIYLPVKTNEGRVFVYQQSNVSNGEFTLVLPYSTEGPAEWSTNFDTAPVSPYQLVVGDRSYQLRVPEEFVIGGGRLEI